MYSKSKASSTITQASLATNATFDFDYRSTAARAMFSNFTTCDDEATLNDGLDNIYANIEQCFLSKILIDRTCHISTTSGGVKHLEGKSVTILKRKHLSSPHTSHVFKQFHKNESL